MPDTPAPPDAAPTPYPVALLLHGCRCLVVGGGPVAARKASGLLASGASVTVVAPAVDPSIEELAASADVAIERRPYRSGEAGDFRLVITATGVPEVDRAVSLDADGAGVWVNSADDIENCTFILPAVHREGPVTVAVSTGGSSPAMARWLSRRVGASIREDLGDALALLAGMLADVRGELHAQGRSTESVDWQVLLDGPLTALVREGRLDEARSLLGRTVAPPG